MQKNKPPETVIVVMLGLIAIYWFKRSDILLLSAVVIGGVSVLVPSSAKGIHWAWMRLSHVLGTVSGTVILTLVFIFLLLPLSLMAKWFGKGGIRLKSGGKSYFKERSHKYVKEDLIHPW
jgi:hypothetical protein